MQSQQAGVPKTVCVSVCVWAWGSCLLSKGHWVLSYLHLWVCVWLYSKSMRHFTLGSLSPCYRGPSIPTCSGSFFHSQRSIYTPLQGELQLYEQQCPHRLKSHKKEMRKKERKQDRKKENEPLSSNKPAWFSLSWASCRIASFIYSERRTTNELFWAAISIFFLCYILFHSEGVEINTWNTIKARAHHIWNKGLV